MEKGIFLGIDTITKNLEILLENGIISPDDRVDENMLMINHYISIQDINLITVVEFLAYV